MSENVFTLPGRFIDLELLNQHHNQGLCQVVASKKLWQHPQTFIPTVELIPLYIQLSMKETKNGHQLPFAIVEKNSQKVVGSIKIQNLQKDCAEIGSTFIQAQHQKTSINKEAKLILMKYVFEVLGLSEINFIVHEDNLASQKSLEAFGIKQSSTFCHLKTMPQWEDDVYINYKVKTKEWATIKENLEKKLFS